MRSASADFDDEYFRHIQWAHLASGGAGGGMLDPEAAPVTTSLRIASLCAGTYEVTLFDTVAGEVISRAAAHSNGAWLEARDVTVHGDLAIGLRAVPA